MTTISERGLISSSGAMASPMATLTPIAWAWCGAIILVAAVLRLVFFAGHFGSDEVVYLGRAIAIADGEWTPSNYIGAIRYGINLPLATVISIFGRSEAALSGFYIFCSLLEILLIFIVACAIWGLRSAIFAAMILAFLPLHVYMSGTMLPDPWLSLVVTSSFVFFYFGERSENMAFYVLAGLAAGIVFWIKEVVFVFILAFAGYALVQGKWRRGWTWMIAAVALVVAANVVFFWALYGDALHVLRAIQAKIGWAYDSGSPDEDSPGYYLNYLFVKIYHVWLLGFAAAAGTIAWLWKHFSHPEARDDGVYVVVWMVGLLVVFSLTPISLSPVSFILKQVNYLTLFLAPLALMAGYGLARLHGVGLAVAVVSVLGGSLVLSAAEQVNAQTFTANSRAAESFARSHPDAPVFGTTNNANISLFNRMLARDGRTAGAIQPLKSADQVPPAAGGEGVRAYVVVDEETMSWGAYHTRIVQPPACWQRVTQLEPDVFGLGWHLLDAVRMGIAQLALLVPAPALQGLDARFGSFLSPAPAYVYRVPADCTFTLDG